MIIFRELFFGIIFWISGDFFLVKIRLILLLRGFFFNWVGGNIYIVKFPIVQNWKKKRKKELTMIFCFPVYRTVSQFAIVVSKAFLGVFFWGDKKDPWVLSLFFSFRKRNCGFDVYICFFLFGKKIMFSFFILFVFFWGERSTWVFFLVL